MPSLSPTALMASSMEGTSLPSLLILWRKVSLFLTFVPVYSP